MVGKKARWVIGVCGGTGAGKTSLCHQLAKAFDGDTVVLPHDMYYKDLSFLSPREREAVNFDHPDALDNDLFLNHLSALKAGKAIMLPRYDFATHTRVGSTGKCSPAKLVIAEGVLLFTNPKIRQLFDYKIYLDAEPDLRFIRRLQRDVNERTRTLDSVVEQWLKTVKPMYDTYVEPSKAYADLVVSGSPLDLVIKKINGLIHGTYMTGPRS